MARDEAPHTDADPDPLDRADRQALDDAIEDVEAAARGCLGQLIDRIRRHILQWMALFFLAFAVGAPWLVKVNLWADPTAFRWVEADAVPEATRADFRRLTTALTPEGFRPIGWVRTDISPGSVVFLGVLADHDNRVWASTLAVFNASRDADGGEQLASTHSATELVTPLADGARLTTSNIAWPKAFAEHDGVIEHRHPTVDDPLALLRLHLEERFAARVFPEPLGDADHMLAVARQQSEREMAAQVAAGRFHLDPTTGLYRPTWKGAFVMTYSQLFDVLLGGDDDAQQPRDAG